MEAVIPNPSTFDRLVRLFCPSYAAKGDALLERPCSRDVDENGPDIFARIHAILPDAGIRLGGLVDEAYARSCLGGSYFNVTVSPAAMRRMESNAIFRESVLDNLAARAEEIDEKIPGMFLALKGFVVADDGSIGSWTMDLPERSHEEASAEPVLMLKMRTPGKLAGSARRCPQRGMTDSPGILVT